LNTDIEIRIRGKVVVLRKSNAQTIDVRGEDIEITNVPHSSITNISSLSMGATSMTRVGHHGDLVVGAGQSMSVSTSLFGSSDGSSRTVERKAGQSFTHTSLWSPLAWLRSQPEEPAPEKTTDTEDTCHSSGDFAVSECRVCLEAPGDGAFLPCGHKCCCLACGTKLDRCPICRAEGFVVHISYVAKSQRIYV
jgi:hypothetical protein